MRGQVEGWRAVREMKAFREAAGKTGLSGPMILQTLCLGGNAHIWTDKMPSCLYSSIIIVIWKWEGVPVCM